MAGPKATRVVYRSEVARTVPAIDPLERYVADRAPLFYRSPEMVLSTMRDGYFLTALRETLRRLPTSERFQESHFGEILAGIVAEEILGWTLLYSKLRLTTAENENPKKTDLVMYDSAANPLEFVFASVKMSPKANTPAGHDQSCYADLVRSFNEYSASDLEFDLTAAKDRLDVRPQEERERVREALRPYRNPPVRFAGFAIIDSATHLEPETAVLQNRKCDRDFVAELLCIDELRDVALSSYGILSDLGNRV